MVKNFINSRTITVAIGILVAMVIAFTLLVWQPKQEATPAGLLVAPKSMFNTAKSFFKAAIPETIREHSR